VGCVTRFNFNCWGCNGNGACVRILLACHLYLKRFSNHAVVIALVFPHENLPIHFCHVPASLLTHVPSSKALFVTAEERCYSLDLPFGFFAALLSFTLLVLSRGVDPIEDFCSLTAYMSRAPSNLLGGFYSPFVDRRLEYVVAQKDGILYIVGGYMLYSSAYSNYNGPSSYILLMRSLRLLTQINVPQYV